MTFPSKDFIRIRKYPNMSLLGMVATQQVREG